MVVGFSQKKSLENRGTFRSTVKVGLLLKNQWQVRLNNCNKKRENILCFSAGRRKDFLLSKL